MSIIVSFYPPSSNMGNKYYCLRAIQAIKSALRKGYQAVVISPLRIIEGQHFTLRFTLRTRITEQIEILESPDMLARRMSELKINTITIESRAKSRHVFDLLTQILNPDETKSIRDFNRPSITIQQEKPADPSARPHPFPPSEFFIGQIDRLKQLKEAKDFPRDNPFQNLSLQEIWQAQNKYHPDKAIENLKELDNLIEWLDFMLKTDKHGIYKRWILFYGEDQIEPFKEKLSKLKFIRNNNDKKAS